MTPDFKIEVNGKDKTALWTDRVISITVNDNDGITADSVVITLDDRDHKLATPAYDEKMVIWLGFTESGIKLAGTFSVNETVAKLDVKQLVISAKAADMIATLKEQRLKSWHNTTLGAVAGSIATSHGLTLAMSSELQAVAIAHVDQTEESDMNLLTRLSLKHDALFKVGDNKLIFTARGHAVSASGAALPSTDINYSDLVKGNNSIRANGRAKHNGVKCRWRDVAKAKTKTVTVGAGKPWFTIREAASSEAAARDKASAKLSQLKRGEMTLNLSLMGDVGLAAGSECVLRSGFKTEYTDSRWSIKTARHTLDGSGFKTVITGELPTQ